MAKNSFDSPSSSSGQSTPHLTPAGRPLESFLGINPADFEPEFRPAIDAARALNPELPDDLSGHVIYIIEKGHPDLVEVVALPKPDAVRWEEQIDREHGPEAGSLCDSIREFSAGPGEVLIIVISRHKRAQLNVFCVRDVMLSEGSDAQN